MVIVVEFRNERGEERRKRRYLLLYREIIGNSIFSSGEKNASALKSYLLKYTFLRIGEIRGQGNRPDTRLSWNTLARSFPASFLKPLSISLAAKYRREKSREREAKKTILENS